ncbi:MAG: hypothetical protein ACE5EY_04750 [Anaerolineae bacterium]
MSINPTQPSPADPAQQQLIAQAKVDLANRLNVTGKEIGLVAFEQVIWPDGSLGCPRPDMAYKQVQQDGYRIRLQVGKRLFNYHGGGGRPPFLCENVKPFASTPLPPPGLGDD